jgi:uncharacterized protein YdiU (UPF0061 family)
VSASTATGSYPAQYSPEWQRATHAWAHSSTSLRAAISIHQAPRRLCDRSALSRRKGAERPYLALLQAVAARQAAHRSWMHVGFIHGVMNTDNMALSGETIDLDPAPFWMRTIRIKCSARSINPVAMPTPINPTRRSGISLALPKLCCRFWTRTSSERSSCATSDLAVPNAVRTALARGHASKARLDASSQDEDQALAQALLDSMQHNQVDFTLMFRGLCDVAESSVPAIQPAHPVQQSWRLRRMAARWKKRLSHESCEPASARRSDAQVNPAFIPRNHRIEQVIAAASEREDFSLFAELLLCCQRRTRSSRCFRPMPSHHWPLSAC